MVNLVAWKSTDSSPAHQNHHSPNHPAPWLSQSLVERQSTHTLKECIPHPIGAQPALKEMGMQTSLRVIWWEPLGHLFENNVVSNSSFC